MARKTSPHAQHTYTPASAVEAGILRGLHEAVAFERGELPGVKVTRRLVTARQAEVAPAPDYTPARVRKVRRATKLSQAVFAQALNVSPETVRAWEQGKKPPSGAALRLLQITERHPELIIEAVHLR
jgi:putative transcriptional regulator